MGCVKLYRAMGKEYFNKLKFLWLNPAEFFDQDFGPEGEKNAYRFAVLTGLLVALELGISEALSGGSRGIVAFVTVFLLAGMPLAVAVWVYLWTAFVKLCAYLLGESLPTRQVRLVVAYSLAGLIALGLGFGLGKWLALAIFLFQVFGIEKTLSCSRLTAVVFVGLPFSMLVVLAGFFTLMFKVFK